MLIKALHFQENNASNANKITSFNVEEISLLTPELTQPGNLESCTIIGGKSSPHTGNNDEKVPGLRAV